MVEPDTRVVSKSAMDQREVRTVILRHDIPPSILQPFEQNRITKGSRLQQYPFTTIVRGLHNIWQAPFDMIDHSAQWG